MASTPLLTRNDRAERSKQIVAAYEAGATSRTLAERFGLTDSHVRSILRLYGVARPVGRPRKAA